LTTILTHALRSGVMPALGLPVIWSLLFCPGPAFAEADGPDVYRVVGVVAGDVLNMRAEPDPHAEKVGEIPPGADCVRNLGCQGGLTFAEYSTLDADGRAKRARENPRWCKVDYKGTTGWVAGRFLAEGGCAP